MRLSGCTFSFEPIPAFCDVDEPGNGISVAADRLFREVEKGISQCLGDVGRSPRTGVHVVCDMSRGDGLQGTGDVVAADCFSVHGQLQREAVHCGQ